MVPYIKELLRDLKADLNVLSYNELDTLTDVYEIIDKAIVDDPPVAVKEGGIIKEGFNEEVDRLRSASKDGKKWIAHLESKERKEPVLKFESGI